MTANDTSPEQGQDGDGSMNEYRAAFAELAAIRLEAQAVEVREPFATISADDLAGEQAERRVDELYAALNHARAVVDEVAQAHPDVTSPAERLEEAGLAQPVVSVEDVDTRTEGRAD